MKNSFFLVIPPQEAKPERLKEYDAKAVEQWLFELPTANPGLATRLLQDYITDLNALRMPLQLRLDVLEKIRPKMLIIEDYLRSRLIKTAFPKEENDIKILQVLTLIEREFTIGYWIVLKELANRPVSWFQGKNLALTLQRTIKGLCSVVVSHFIMGSPVPDWVWIDLHSLHKLSAKLKKDSVKVADEANLFTKASSPDECYRQILMLSLAQPSGLMQKEIPLVYHFIETLFPLFSLSASAIEGQQMQFVVLADEDKPPFGQVDMHTDKHSTTTFLDFTRLYKAFEKKAKHINPTESRFTSMHVLKSHENKPSSELFDYLEMRWLGTELHTRKDVVFTDRLDRYIAIGMGPAHSLQSSDSTEGWASGSNESEYEILARSESDRLLFCIFDKPGSISVGNLISIRKVDQPRQKSSLGVVNELIVAKQSNKISFGVSILAKRYHAVVYALAESSEKDNKYKGLFYNAEEQLLGTSFIVVDNFMVKEDDNIKMVMGQEVIHLLLKDKKNVGLGYWQFECQRIAARVDKPQTKKGYDFI